MEILNTRKIALLTFTIILLSASLISSISCASSLLIWPLNQTIEQPNNATSLWVQNNGKEPVFLQIRVLQWQQANNQDLLSEQQDLLVSPPVTEIPAGEKQLIRIKKNINVLANNENSYRILIDEIPRDDLKANTNTQGYGVTFQIRYSIPLFIQGENIWTNQDYKKVRDINTATQPELTYKLQTKAGKRFLVIKNTGKVHARISNVAFTTGKNISTVSEGLLGYVLANQTMDFPIPTTVKTEGSLQAKINEMPKPLNIKSY